MHISFSELTACAGCRVLVQCVVYLQFLCLLFGRVRSFPLYIPTHEVLRIEVSLRQHGEPADDTRMRPPGQPRNTLVTQPEYDIEFRGLVVRLGSCTYRVGSSTTLTWFQRMVMMMTMMMCIYSWGQRRLARPQVAFGTRSVCVWSAC